MKSSGLVSRLLFCAMQVRRLDLARKTNRRNNVLFFFAGKNMLQNTQGILEHEVDCPISAAAVKQVKKCDLKVLEVRAKFFICQCTGSVPQCRLHETAIQQSVHCFLFLGLVEFSVKQNLGDIDLSHAQR